MIRGAVAEDASSLSMLLGQLGYPAAPEEIVVRLRRLESCGFACNLVAESGSEVIGLATGHAFPSIHATPVVAWLTTLVVDQQFIGKGVGKALAGAIEAWARGRGAVRLSVTSGNHRDRTHAFYEHVGYERTGVRLTKALG